MATKKAKKKAVKASKNGSIPVPTTLAWDGKKYQVRFSDDTDHFFRPEDLSPEWHKYLNHTLSRVESGRLILISRGFPIEFKANELLSIANPKKEKSDNNIRFKMDADKVDRILHIYNNFPSWMAKQMKLRKMNQPDVTEKSGLNTSTINWYVKGKLKPKFNSFMALLKAFKIPLDKL
jgi:hypothetical protein